MDKKLLMTASAVAAVLVLTACSEAPTPAEEAKPAVEAKKEPPKAPEPVAAQTAFWEMYKPARAWATDLQPLSVASGEAASMKNADGKAATWTAVFVSPSRREARTFFYSVVDDGANIHKGVSAGGAMTWSGATPQSKPFNTQDFATNSDAAYKAAYAKAEEWVKKNPDKKASLALAASSKFDSPVWLVLWGNSKSGYAVYVNATTGLVVTK